MYQYSGIITILSKEYRCFFNNDEIMISFDDDINELLDFKEKPTNKSFLLETDGPIKSYYYLFIGNLVSCEEHGCFYKLKMIIPFCNDPNPKIEKLEICSAGFINFFNDYSGTLNPFEEMEKIIKKEHKELCNLNLDINGKNYNMKAYNYIILLDYEKRRNVMPYNFTTAVELSSDKIEYCDICPLYEWAMKLLQFITVNKYTKIDFFSCALDNGCEGHSDPIVSSNYDYKEEGIDCVLSYSKMKRNNCLFFENIDKILKYPRRLYILEEKKVNIFDIVSISGTFEYVFEKYVKTSADYLNKLAEMKKSVFFDEIADFLKEHKENHELKNNVDFTSAIKVFSDYGGTLKNKLDFVFNEFVYDMGYDMSLVLNFDFLYNPTKLATRLKDARNDLCHGLDLNKEIDWIGALNDAKLVQELVYYIVLKHFLKLEGYEIREILSKTFRNINGSFIS